MPTTTFYNLPDEKRDRLILAIKDEFSRVPFDEVSINKIVQAADIPRGSFYQYFADKNDMLGFILFDYKAQMIQHIKKSLIESKGDVFTMFREVLEFTIHFASEEKTNNFLNNLFADIKVNMNFYLEARKSLAENEALKEMNYYVNLETLDIREATDFINMLDILVSICRDATVEVFLNRNEAAAIKANYFQKLELLKRGFVKTRSEENVGN